MDSRVKRYLRYYSAPVLCAVFTLLSFCCLESIGLFLGILGVAGMYFALRDNKKIQLCFANWVVLVLLSVEIIAGFFNNPGIYAKTYLFGLFFNVLIYFILRIFLRKDKQETLFLNILAGFVILLAVLTVGSFYFFKFNIEYEGFSNLVDFKSIFSPLGFLLNDWATIMLLSSVFVLLALIQSHFNTPWFWVLLAGLGAVLMSIVFSFSRGAYLSVFLGLLVFFGLGFLLKIAPIKKMLLFSSGAILLVILTALPVQKEFITTIGMSETTSQVRSTSGRVELGKAAYQLIQKEPLTGYGNAQFSLRASPYLTKKEDATFSGRATNSYLQLLAEQGIIGFIPWLIWIGLLLFSLLRLIKQKGDKSLSSLTIFAVFLAVLFRELSFSTFFEKTQMQLLFFVLAALLVNWDKTKNRAYSLSVYVLPGLLSILFVVLTSIQIRYKIAAKKNNTFIEKVQEGNYPDALNAINQAICFDPQNSLLNANKGFLLNSLQHKDSSTLNGNENPLTYYKKAVTYSPYDPYLQQNLAWLFFMADQKDSAAIYFHKACELSDNSALFHISKGLFQEKTGTADLGLAEFKKAIRLSPDLLDSEFSADLESKNQERFKTMLHEITDSLTIKIATDNSPILKSRLAKIILTEGDTVHAMQLFEQASNQLPNLDRPWYYRGMVKLAQNDTITFLKYLNRTALLDPRDYLYPLALGNYFHSRNQKRDAIYYYQNALFNQANLYAQHTMIVPKWYGYKTLSNPILPQNLTSRISPVFDQTEVLTKLTELYKSLGQDREVRLVEKYKNGELTINQLQKEIYTKN